MAGKGSHFVGRSVRNFRKASFGPGHDRLEPFPARRRRSGWVHIVNEALPRHRNTTCFYGGEGLGPTVGWDPPPSGLKLYSKRICHWIVSWKWVFTKNGPFWVASPGWGGPRPHTLGSPCERWMFSSWNRALHKKMGK
jgi:hypothetical protein